MIKILLIWVEPLKHYNVLNQDLSVDTFSKQLLFHKSATFMLIVLHFYLISLPRKLHIFVFVNQSLVPGVSELK